MEFFNTLIVNPLLNLLVAIYQVLDGIGIPSPLGFSIIVLTIIIRLAISPLITSQLKASKKMQDLSPKIANIKDRFKGDSKRIQAETMKLYKENGVNPAAGCLPTLLQLPIIWGLYSVLNKVVHLPSDELLPYVNGIVFEKIQLTEPWDTTFFGIPLGESPQKLLATMAVVAIMIPVITGLFQFIQSKMLFVTPPSVKGKKKNDDFATVFQTQSTYIFPVMIGIFSFTLPVGLSLYWITFSIFGIIHQYKIMGPGGLVELWQKIQKILKK